MAHDRISDKTAATDDPFINSLISKCSPAPYDQVIFLSQKTINDAFANMWALADPTSPIRSIDITTRDQETIKGKLKPPTVIINVVDADTMIYFQWNFESGSMTLFTTDNPNDPTTKTFDVSNWTVAFSTKLSRDTIPPSDPSYQGYVTAMGASGIFSLNKLYVESQENAGYYPQGSNFQGIDWSQETKAIQSHFEQLRNVWIDAMDSGALTHIAVMLQTDQPQTVNPNAPTFPPSSIDHTVYPWKDPVNPLPVSNSSDSNALAYLIMTNNDTAPIPPQISYTGTWVDTAPSEPGRGAILCMKSSEFWESWLLPLLQVVNLATQIQPLRPDVEYIGNDTWQVRMNWIPSTSTQHPSMTDNYYQFKKSPDGKTWTWTADSSLLASSNSVSANNTNYSMTENATATTTVTFAQGGQAFSITGSNTATMNTNSTGDFTSNSSMSFTMQYQLNFAVTRVDDGGLQILSTTAPQVTNGDVNTSQSEGQIWTPPLDQYGRTLQQTAFSQFQANLNYYQTAFVNGLAGQNKLILPGAGTYLCNNVMFTNAGDFTTNLFFNGAPPPGGTPNIPDFLRHSPPRQPASGKFTYKPPAPVPSMVMKVIKTSANGTGHSG